MRFLALFFLALSAHATDCVISDTLTNFDGTAFTGRVEISLNNPASAQPLYTGSTTLTGWRRTVTVTAGAFAVTLVCTDSITPSGTSYSARFIPSQGAPWTETWTPATGTTTVRAMRSTTVPTPTATFQASQLALAAGSMVYGSSAGVGTALAAGSNGQVLALSGGYPAWTTNIAGNAGTATALAANGTNCAAGTFPLGVDASGNSESCTALPTTISGTANQITASAATGAITLSLPATITGLTSVTSTGFTGALTGNASTATALSSTVASGRLWIGQGTGVPTSDSVICADTTNHRLGVGTCSPAYTLDVAGGARMQGIDGVAGIDMSINTASTNALKFSVNNSEKMRLASTTGNLLIGGTTDGNYKLEVANSGSSGTLRVYDQTATTGVTKAVIRAGAGQSTTNLTEWQNYAGTVLLATGSTGRMFGPRFTSLIDNGWALQDDFDATDNLLFASSRGLAWSSTVSFAGSKDIGLRRAAAGYLKVTDGSTGLGKIVVSQSTPSASTDACTAGALWADASYVYACTASGVIKRATLAAF